MDRFADALLSTARNPAMPEEYDWYAPMLGDWECVYTEPDGSRVEGEWYFRRALDGMAIEDVFIFPSRATRETNYRPDAEYGAAIRMYREGTGKYDMTYVCAGHTQRLEIQKQGEEIVCSVLKNPAERWIFSEITADSFHWRNVCIQPDGTERMNCEVCGRRIG
ncbi:MAG: hypothetical protein PUJ35_03695 [Ruminococcus bromii]|nr:hypothetical protein [Ruminococcus bromii]